MEYWIKIGLTMAMIVVIPALSSESTATAKPDIANTKKPKTPFTYSTSSTAESFTTTKQGNSLSCRNANVNGTECPENKKCPINDICEDPSQCPCMDGYEAYNDTTGNIAKITCDDIQECNLGTHKCGPFTECNNTQGAYFCVCNKGFRRGNETEFCPTNNKKENGCSDIDECTEDPNICGPNSKCNNTRGSYHCVCLSGFKNISNTCTVRCKQEDKIKSECNPTMLECILEEFTEQWKPRCSDSNTTIFDSNQLLNGLSDMISKFINQKEEKKKEKLRLAGTLLNGVESVVQNLAYVFTTPMYLSNKDISINALIINRTYKDETIHLKTTNSAIHLGRKAALGNTYTSVFGYVEYKNIKALLEGAELKNNSQNQTVKLVSTVVSVFLGIANTSNLIEPIQLQFNFTDEEVTPNKTHCAFWSKEDSAWSIEGCETLERHAYGVVCNCTHLTSFAILMALDNIESWTLSLITKVGLSISIVCLSAAIITFCLCRFLRGTRNTIHIHLCVSLLLGHCIFLIGVEATSDMVVCGIVAGLLHFFYLSAFCWMSLEGLELYLMLVTVFKTQVKTRYLLAMGYGVPTVIIIISAAVYSKGYGTEKHCWLSTKRNFIWSFMGPVCVIILINCGIFVLTVWKLAEKMSAINPEQGKLKRIRSLTVTSVAQLCILGCCWAFGFLMFGKTTLVFAYAFTICNVLQGVQIFFLHCLMNKKVREKYVDVICALAHFRSPLYSEFSNSTNVNTQSRAKVSKESGL